MGSAHRAAMGGARAPRRPTRGLRPRPPAPAPSPVAKGVAAGVAGGLGSEGGVRWVRVWPRSVTVAHGVGMLSYCFKGNKEYRTVEKMRKSAYGWNLGENEKSAFFLDQSKYTSSIYCWLVWDMGWKKAKINYFSLNKKALTILRHYSTHPMSQRLKLHGFQLKCVAALASWG